MYLHIGMDFMLPEDDIIGVFDLDNTTTSKITRDFLNSAENGKNLINASEDIPKSFVVCERDGEEDVYLSQLGTQTLLRRSGTVLSEQEIRPSGTKGNK